MTFRERITKGKKPGDLITLADVYKAIFKTEKAGDHPVLRIHTADSPDAVQTFIRPTEPQRYHREV